ncbi:SlyX family protein [Flavobacterium sp. LaA7.5]|nr:SlyX family protein [Flavobacterium salilacus subsp. altitudinum]
MKTKFFLMAGLLVTAFGYSQTTTYYPAPTGTYPTGAAGTGGARSVHVGNLAGSNAVTGTGDAQSAWNVFVGEQAGQDNQSGDSNVYVGGHAGENSTVGNNNVYVGMNAGLNSNGSSNVFIGASAGAVNVGSESVMVGNLAGANNTEDDNTFIGRMAGQNSLGKGNVFLGHEAGRDETGDNKLYIDNSETTSPLIYGEFDTGRLVFNAERVGIGYDGNSEFGEFPSFSGTPDLSSYRLFVRGGILAEEVRIRTYTNWPWPDYVFAADYKLMPLAEVAQYISDNGHLPNMPSAKEVETEGLELGNIAKLQQEKIEELTLHLIEQKEEIETLKKQVQLLLNKK